MSRITKEEIELMNGPQRRAYVDSHPSEGIRFIETSGSEVKFYAGRFAEYQKSRIAEAYFGSAINTLDFSKK